jgi:succinyl-CoA synthetase beta subunit
LTFIATGVAIVKIHEFQAKKIMKRYGIPVPEGGVARSPDEVRGIAERFDGKVVVKAQVLAGGRGKGIFKEDPELHGVYYKIKNVDHAVEIAGRMLGNTLVTRQTGPSGLVVQNLLVEKFTDIANELYLGMVVDREKEKIVIMASTEGGMEIEEVAQKSPGKITKVWVEPEKDIDEQQLSTLIKGFGLGDDAQKKLCGEFIQKLLKLFIKEDASLAELNPLVMTKTKKLLALDAKITLDDNAEFRHADTFKNFRDTSVENILESKARKYGFSYVKLEPGPIDPRKSVSVNNPYNPAEIGCMVNGAGLAMATMDLILLLGSGPANFLDVGGAADPEVVENAFEVLLEDKDVKVILINIFGGIVKCDVVAEGIVHALKELEQKRQKVEVPVVVRLRGTNNEEGLKILKDSPLEFTLTTRFAEAASKAVSIAKGRGG